MNGIEDDPTPMMVSPIRNRLISGGLPAGAGRLLAGRIVAFFALLMLVLPAMPCEAAHAETHLHAAGVLHGVLGPETSAPSPDKADCGLQARHACGCHAVMAVADAEPPALPEPGLSPHRPAAEFGEPRATAPPRRPPRA